ncbi:hypothetical protein M9978_01860 [Sphingomonas sp. MG17]|uniref:Uncharacterized protein n=1 Tax=Sphingomonas tagetis TaxID=2949092 RepID=A0A9X2KJX2_9SPHN|nr:hypothetical protein [Sphingomonas tagetis]MCP3729160.1 hypothetical protein [Sphingomonas tagetis]
MRKFLMIAGGAALLAAAPAMAGFKLMPAGQPQLIRKSALTVTPGIAWNRLGARLGRNAEAWTLDGNTLNDLIFYTAIPAGQTLFREVDKKNKPLPKFDAKMLAPDVVAMFESSYRIANSTSLFSVDSVEPATFAGKPGFRFTYSFTIQNEEVRRSGEATGAIVNGQLYMITFEAPKIHYYDRNIADYRAVVASAKVG